MTDISAFELDSVASCSKPDRKSFSTTLLSMLFIVGFPACFWLSLLELANYALSLGISNSTRLILACSLIGFLTMIWGFIAIGARQRRT